MAPEIFAGLSYTYAVDYWALGILMFEMLYSFQPFDGHGLEPTLKRMVMENALTFPKHIAGDPVPEAIKDLVSKLLIKSQIDRLQSLENFSSHEVFSKFNWPDLKEQHLVPDIIPDASSQTINFDDSLFGTLDDVKLDQINPNIKTAFASFDELISTHKDQSNSLSSEKRHWKRH